MPREELIQQQGYCIDNHCFCSGDDDGFVMGVFWYFGDDIN